MERTRNQLENLLKDELIDEVLSLEYFKNDINAKFSEPNDCFNDFQAKHERVNSNLSILRRCNDFLLEHITQLGGNKLNKTISIVEEKLLTLTQCHLILLMMSWNNLFAKCSH